MDDLLRAMFLRTSSLAYQSVRPFLFQRSAQQTHADVIELLRGLDDSRYMQSAANMVYQLAFKSEPIFVGGVRLPHPFILAAGFVKGDGFASETDALAAVRTGHNIIPGWQTMPNLVGLVEFGSFTRWPRPGNPGTVIWRDLPSRSTQNRVGLKNPGAVAAAEFLSQRKLPETFGINIAVSPGVHDPQKEQQEIAEAVEAFTSRGIRPSWFTLNISCPNTEDDPQNNQTESKTRALCQTVVSLIGETPLWVKISPELAESQYQVLMRVFHENDVKVKAVIATNTLPRPAPDQTTAGVGGGKLLPHSMRAASTLIVENQRHNYQIDVIGCGGIQTPADYAPYMKLGIHAVQYWSGIVYRGPLVAAMLQQETSCKTR